MLEFDCATWSPDQLAVLCFIIHENNVLLIRKLRGHGSGKINGPGGKCEIGESPVETAIRETQEEVCVTPHELIEMGTLRFHFSDGFQLEGRVFVANSYTGSIADTDEAKPFWCSLNAIPYNEMWSDDILWLPHVLNGQYIEGNYSFQTDTMTSHQTTVLGCPVQNKLLHNTCTHTFPVKPTELILKAQQFYTDLIHYSQSESFLEFCDTCGFSDLAKAIEVLMESSNSTTLNPNLLRHLQIHYLRAISVLTEQVYESRCCTC